VLLIVIKVSHLITGLSTGGAEMMLYKLLSRKNSTFFEHQVISMTDQGPVGEKIQALGVSVKSLGMLRGIPNPLKLRQLVVQLQETRPQILQTWMYHADLMGGIAAKLAGNIPVLWGIRHGNLVPDKTKLSTFWTAKVCAYLSDQLPTRIICCSIASEQIHREIGYTANKMVVIPNGFDLSVFQPEPTARQSVRQELGIPAETLLIGLVGRFDPQKDHRNFVKAASQLQPCLPDVHFLLCGDKISWKNRKLVEWIELAGMRDRFHLLGLREDIAYLTAALDIATSASAFGEGFPNVIGEAMACGVPCVVTDVGDSAWIVGDTGRVVPPQNALALANAWQELIKLGGEGRTAMGQAARLRIMRRFSLDAIVAQYELLYNSVLQEASYRRRRN
jgi:glycosyltransferase involved in cell wall biosynthesis